MEEKKETLKDKLAYKPRNAYEVLSEEEVQAAFDYCEQYKAFLDEGKTEREVVTAAIARAEAAGYRPFCEGMKLAPGDKVYYNNRGKSLLLAVIGTAPLSEGASLAAAHIDSPRLDLKPNPLYENHGLAYLDTHYYGGIKKYQWLSIPLALHGVIVRRDGTRVSVSIGEKDEEPVFCITDLLPHLSQNQMKKTGAELVDGENLDVLIASRPFAEDDESEAVKLNVLRLLNEKYGIVEEDFLSAELEVVPAFRARDLGLDRALIGAYGHDDRVCAYPALTAQLSLDKPYYTAVTLLADKEETGSEGNTGTSASFVPYFFDALAACFGLAGRQVLSKTLCLSADVNVAYDPLYPDVVESRNCAVLNGGVVLTKYTGARGKSSTNDASAELMGYYRRLMNRENVVWQIGELGRVDVGGGGTVAKYIASLDVDTVDLGVPMLAMHAPFEVVSKPDVYMAHKAFSALLGRTEKF